VYPCPLTKSLRTSTSRAIPSLVDTVKPNSFIFIRMPTTSWTRSSSVFGVFIRGGFGGFVSSCRSGIFFCVFDVVLLSEPQGIDLRSPMRRSPLFRYDMILRQGSPRPRGSRAGRFEHVFTRRRGDSRSGGMRGVFRCDRARDIVCIRVPAQLSFRDGRIQPPVPWILFGSRTNGDAGRSRHDLVG